MKSKPRVNNLSDVIGPPTVTVQVSKTESAQAYRGIKRGAGLHASWVVHYRGKNALFFDRDYDFNWRQSLFAAEEHMRSVYVPSGSVFGKPKCTLVKVKRPYSKDPSDLIERVRLSRFGGGYKFFDLDPTLNRTDSIMKARYQAEEWHWDQGLSLGLIECKPGKDAHRLKLLGLLDPPQ